MVGLISAGVISGRLARDHDLVPALGDLQLQNVLCDSCEHLRTGRRKRAVDLHSRDDWIVHHEFGGVVAIEFRRRVTQRGFREYELSLPPTEFVRQPLHGPLRDRYCVGCRNRDFARRQHRRMAMGDVSSLY